MNVAAAMWHHEPMSDLVQIYSSGDPFATDLMKSRLEAEGIAALSKGGAQDAAYPAGPSYLFVAAEDETRARAIVDAVESGAFAVQDEGVEQPAGADDT
jgi:hypothetical protein